ncbi:MAG TPA: putative ABC transporter permease [Candidatus Blautia faecavium]|uniref:ABC transporter permease n=1 Tax=Candidatus Blautia faecavium TaxID=2838487 RepID=A0A9D2RXK0_9FIRM|nr:putative ABC transporter permease [Candidatus Blautia faecavium]
MQLFYEFVIMLFIFSILGWIMEVTLKFIQYHRFINRGFLIGPYCPIYGFGVVGVTILVGGLIGRAGTYPETFMAGFIICGFLEYMTSFYMEKMFHARWWDYSNKPMNLHGRIWIGNLILFGIASVIIVKFIDPYYFNYIETINPIAVNIIAWMIIILMVGDYILSHILMNIVKKEIDNSTGDNTEEISRQIHELLRNRSALQRRILQAYPDFRVLPHNFVEKYKQAKKDYQKARKEFISVLTKRFNKDFNKDLFLRAKKELEEKYQVLNQLADNFRKKF